MKSAPVFVLVPVLVELGVVLAALEVAASPAVGLVPASGLGLGLDPVLVQLEVVLVELEVAAVPGPAENLGGGPDVVVCTGALDNGRLGLPVRAVDDGLDVQPILGGAPAVRLLP